MAALLPFTVFRVVPGVLDFVPIEPRIHEPDINAATRVAADLHPFRPIVCHAHTGGREPVDFSLIPAPARRSRRYAA